ncbi:unnamed protein product [Paramecium sonneborni]|uniref:Uncharacterized protein n=1 Tax=Paramecium sonneborni TaxID=65129 RepID=A0A8S1RR87_9CILI|nr:unnamed protein product [Paramecium sonneborni]
MQKQQQEELKKTELFAGKFFCQYQSNGNRIGKQDKLKVKIKIFDQNKKISQLKKKLYVVSSNLNPNDQERIVCRVRKEKEQIKTVYNNHGKILHLYDEIWFFLLNADYVKLVVKIMKLNESMPEIAEISVYITQLAIDDDYELKIARQNKTTEQQKILEENQLELLKYARLSMLLMFDFMNVSIEENCLIKQSKQFKIFFAQYCYFFQKSKKNFQVRSLLKSYHRPIIEKRQQQQFENYLNNKRFSNNLFEKSLIQILALYQTDSLSYISQYKSNFLHFWKRLIQLIIIFELVKTFIKRSKNSIQNYLVESYDDYVLKTVFLCTQQLYQKIQQDSIYNNQHKNLIKVRKLITNALSKFNKDKYLLLSDHNLKIYQYQKNAIYDLYFIDFKVHSRQNNYNDFFDFRYYQNQMNQGYSEIENMFKEKHFKKSRKKQNTRNKKDINDIFIFNNLIFEEQETPQLMISKLKKHQKEALFWMLYREGRIKDNKFQQKQRLSPLWQEYKLLGGESLFVNMFTGKVSKEIVVLQETKGGILAEEMCLGKTLMALALILETLNNENQILIVVPKSVLKQWENEITIHSKPDIQIIKFGVKLIILILNKIVKLIRLLILLKEFILMNNPVISLIRLIYMTTVALKMINKINLLLILHINSQMRREKKESQQKKEIKLQQKMEKIEKEKQKKQLSDEKLEKAKDHFNLFKQKYHRVILDEAHNIKTRQTLQSKSANALEADYRWCLTGTPMQNKHDDLFALIQFLKVETFSQYFWWNTYINKEENEEDQIRILSQILQPIILRRTKNSQRFDGLNQVEEEICWVELNEKEKILYQKLLQGSQDIFKHFTIGKNNKSYVHIFQIINKLKLACNHPQLALKEINLDKTPMEEIITKLIYFLKLNNKIYTKNHQLKIQEMETYKNVKFVKMIKLTHFVYHLVVMYSVKKHQKEALFWMLYREGRIKDNKFQQKQRLSPLWQEYKLLGGESLFVNMFTGKVSKEIVVLQETKGGILAEEMCLGKTLMALALILETLNNENQILIVVPKSVLKQWENEITIHSKPDIQIIKFGVKLIILILNKIVKLIRLLILLKEFILMNNPVISLIRLIYMTTVALKMINKINLLLILHINSQMRREKKESQQKKEIKLQQKMEKIEKEKQKKQLSDEKLEKAKDHFNLFKQKYHRVILDEAHNIKTRQTLQSKSANALEADYRWCLTGTPMQNKHDDLFALIQFLKVETFSQYFWWNTYINKEENEEDQIRILSQILQPIILRRTKNSQRFDGLNQVEEEICWVELNEKEKILYQKLLQEQQILCSYLLNNQQIKISMQSPSISLKRNQFRQNTNGRNYNKINLFFKIKQQSTNMTDLYKKSLIENIRNGDIQECEICKNDQIDTFCLSSCGHVFCRKCFTQIINQQSLCPQCRMNLSINDLIEIKIDNETESEDLKTLKYGNRRSQYSHNQSI